MTPMRTKKGWRMRDADRNNGLIQVDATRLAMPKDMLEDSSLMSDLNKRMKRMARVAKEIEDQANVERRDGNGLDEDMDSNWNVDCMPGNGARKVRFLRLLGAKRR